MKKIQALSICFILILSACVEKIERKEFSGTLTNPCMILNFEQDNTIEGKYLTIEEINIHDSIVKIKLPENFYINNSNFKNWIIGWGSKKSLYDAGCENLRTIQKINLAKKILTLGNIVRGEGFPKKGQRIVFWNKNPSGFVNKIKRPIIDPDIWTDFAGKNISFSSIEYDEQLNKWIMIVNECDTSKIQIYAAM
jgi:hypothetical protein